MYKTLYSVTVHPIQGGPFEFVDRIQTPGAGSAALAQLTANKDIDGNGGITHVIIPIHAVDYAEVTEQRRESEYEDNNAKNCVIPDSGETGTLTITAPSEVVEIPANTRPILASAKLNGQYGPLTFSDEAPGGNPFPDGYNSYAYLPAMSSGESIEVPGLPIGMRVLDPMIGTSNSVVVPGTLLLSANI